MAGVDQLERVTNLLALLLETRVPMSLAHITAELEGQYPAGAEARRAAFERDKLLLRNEGVPIESVTLAGDQAGQMGYWIDRAAYELGDLGLADDERRALQVAVATVRLGNSWGEEALWKLGTVDDAATGDLAGVAASLPSLPALAVLFEAITGRAVARFGYHGRDRALRPYGLLAREGFWYVVGFEEVAGEVRTFRVDRIDGVVKRGPVAAFERPLDFDIRRSFPADAKTIGDGSEQEASSAVVLVDASRARSIVLELGEGSIRERRPDGSVVVEVPCANLGAFRSWVLGLVEHAEVLGPPDVRRHVVEWLEGLVRGGRA